MATRARLGVWKRFGAGWMAAARKGLFGLPLRRAGQASAGVGHGVTRFSHPKHESDAAPDGARERRSPAIADRASAGSPIEWVSSETFNPGNIPRGGRPALRSQTPAVSKVWKDSVYLI